MIRYSQITLSALLLLGGTHSHAADAERKEGAVEDVIINVAPQQNPRIVFAALLGAYGSEISNLKHKKDEEIGPVLQEFHGKRASVLAGDNLPTSLEKCYLDEKVQAAITQMTTEQIQEAINLSRMDQAAEPMVALANRHAMFGRYITRTYGSR